MEQITMARRDEGGDAVATGAVFVPEFERPPCLQTHFGEHEVHVEFEIYSMLRRICPGYDGGFWHFYALDNGGFYMAPDVEGELELVNRLNYFEGSVSADAAGVIACMMALSHLSFVLDDERIGEKFYQLRAWASRHPEVRAIWRATD